MVRTLQVRMWSISFGTSPSGAIAYRTAWEPKIAMVSGSEHLVLWRKHRAIPGALKPS
jgi:hypothetical protein